MAEPAITTKAFHISKGSNLPINRVVIHTTSPPGAKGTSSSAKGEAHATAVYFTSSASGGSAQYIEDAAGEEHCVADNEVAQHAPPNTHSIGIEICGEPTYTRDQWLSGDPDKAMIRAAVRTAELCKRFNIPVQKLSVADLQAGKSGICGHVDVSQAFKLSDHTDPGPNFPWDAFLVAVRSGSTTSTPATPSVPNAPQTFPTWEFLEAAVRSTLVQVGPLDSTGRGYADWNPGLGRDPIPVGIVPQGSDPSSGSADDKTGDPYWENQGPYQVKASPRGNALRITVTHGVSGETVGIYVSVA